MGKLLLISVVLASVILPWLAASTGSPTRGLRRTFVWVLAFNVCYLFVLLYVIPRLY